MYSAQKNTLSVIEGCFLVRLLYRENIKFIRFIVIIKRIRGVIRQRRVIRCYSIQRKTISISCPIHWIPKKITARIRRTLLVLGVKKILIISLAMDILDRGIFVLAIAGILILPESQLR